MARGFFGGIIVGTVVSGLGLGAASVMTDLPGRPAPEAAALDVPAGSEFNQSREDVPAELSSQPDTAPQSGNAPEVAVAQPDDLSSIDETDTQPAAVPETGAAEGTLSAPQMAAGDSGVDFGTQSAAQPDVQVEIEAPAEPEEPETATEGAISIDPEQPAPPTVEPATAAFPEEEQAEGDAAAPEAAAPEVAQTEAEMQDATVPETEEAEAAEKPGSTIGNLAENVATNRLPSVGNEPAAAEEEKAVAETAGAGAPGDLPAIEAHAAEFDNPEGKPLMSVVLIDDGTSPIGLDALASFPYPLSFAVDAGWSGAREAMRRYRDAGFEVMAMVDLPEGAQPSDTEIAMQTVLAAVPESVAVLEGTGTGLQSNREGAEQLAPILLESGHGLVLFPKGLDTARKLIEREGVPTASVFRDFDAKGQNATVIRRFLDQAAFKAGRGANKVVMLGRLRADTISALLLWGLQDRASSVALAPISAVLTQAEE